MWIVRVRQRRDPAASTCNGVLTFPPHLRPGGTSAAADVVENPAANRIAPYRGVSTDTQGVGGVNAIAGLSMGAQGAMTLVARNPDLYRGVAALSGCMDTGRVESQAAVRGTVASKGGDADNMWGTPGDPAWPAHDPSVNAEQLRGKDIFVSTGNGLAGPYELGAPDALEKVVVGGPLEAASHSCTQLFDGRLAQLGIPATFLYRPYGTHSWPYWQDDLREAWPTLARSLEI